MDKVTFTLTWLESIGLMSIPLSPLQRLEWWAVRSGRRPWDSQACCHRNISGLASWLGYGWLSGKVTFAKASNCIEHLYIFNILTSYLPNLGKSLHGGSGPVPQTHLRRTAPSLEKIMSMTRRWGTLSSSRGSTLRTSPQTWTPSSSGPASAVSSQRLSWAKPAKKSSSWSNTTKQVNLIFTIIRVPQLPLKRRPY